MNGQVVDMRDSLADRASNLFIIRLDSLWHQLQREANGLPDATRGAEGRRVAGAKDRVARDCGSFYVMRIIVLTPNDYQVLPSTGHE